MSCPAIKNKYLVIVVLQLLSLVYSSAIVAQTVKYSRDEAYVNNPDNLQFVANIAGNHHLLSFSHNETPELFVFNAKLELVNKIKLPFKYPDKASVNIIPFDNYYYCSIHPRFSQDRFFWKIDADGNATDMSAAFKKLLRSQSMNLKLNVQLIPNQNSLWMVYHTALDDPEKTTVVMLQTDSLLNVVFSHKVQYDFKMSEEKLVQETLIFGRYMIVLKTLESGSSLQLMKVNLATGYTITNNFHSSGYLYSQASFSFNTVDSSMTIAALLTEPMANVYSAKQYVFVTRLNKILVEQSPFSLLKTQFRKNVSTSFMLVDSASNWMRFRKYGGAVVNNYAETDITVYRDLTSSGNTEQSVDMDNLISKLNSPRTSTSNDDLQGVRFSLLDKKFAITSDTLISNKKNSYTLKANPFKRFSINNKEYLLVTQQFSTRKNGLMLVNSNSNRGLDYNYLMVKEKYNYILSKSRVIPSQGLIVPYLHKREVGLLKILVYPEVPASAY